MNRCILKHAHRWLLATIFLSTAPCVIADIRAEQIDALTQQWLHTEQQKSRLVSEWQSQKPMVEQRIELLQAEQKQLSEILQRRDEKSDKVDQKREALMAQQSTLEAQQAETDKLIQALAMRLDALEPRLPPPLQNDWNSKANEESSNQLRLQLARLSRMKEFNERTTLHSMRLTEPSTGEEILVKQLYLGLSQAWFASSDGSYRGVGRVDNGIWRWTFRDDISSGSILAAIAITEKQSPAQSIALPVSLVSGSPVPAKSISAHQETTDHEN